MFSAEKIQFHRALSKTFLWLAVAAGFGLTEYPCEFPHQFMYATSRSGVLVLPHSDYAGQAIMLRALKQFKW